MAFHKFLSRLKSFWWLGLPLAIFILESTANRFYPFNSPFFWLVARKLPLFQLEVSLLGGLRSFAFYLIIAVILERLRMALRLRAWPFALLFTVAYLVSIHGIFAKSPELLEHALFSPRATAVGIAVLVFAFGLATWNRGWRTTTAHPRINLIAAVLCVAILWPRSPSPWVIGKERATQPNVSKSSFFLLSFDAVPAALFESASPELKKNWKDQSLNFTAAYSPTNSTFTSWMAVLSGKHPLRSEVDTLFPSPRAGNLRPHDLLPAKLSRTGYRTVFMTDCSTTSFMEPSYGFQEIYQPSPGLRACQNAALAATHPWPAVFSRANGDNFLFPEINSFCSRLSRPAAFFEQVEQKLEELRQSDTPFFLAVHSCLTHRDVQEQLPPVDSPLRQTAETDPLPPSAAKSKLIWSIRLADSYAARLLKTGYRSTKPLWSFIFSDHGVRIEPDGESLKLFSHALGEPRNRYQYQIPLTVIPPVRHRRDFSHLVSLLDIYPTVVELSGLERTPMDGVSLLSPPALRPRSLVLISSVPGIEPETSQSLWAEELSKGKYAPDGTFAFSAEQQTEMRKSRTLALIKLPYRYLHFAGGNEALYQEEFDPFNQTDLIADEPKLGRQLKKELCDFYAPGCVPTLFTRR